MKKQDISEIPTMLHAAVRPLFRPFTMPTKQSAEQYRQNTGINEEVMQIPIPISQSTSSSIATVRRTVYTKYGKKGRKKAAFPTNKAVNKFSITPVIRAV